MSLLNDKESELFMSILGVRRDKFEGQGLLMTKTCRQEDDQ
jgi:hypothetical protein